MFSIPVIPLQEIFHCLHNNSEQTPPEQELQQSFGPTQEWLKQCLQTFVDCNKTYCSFNKHENLLDEYNPFRKHNPLHHKAIDIIRDDRTITIVVLERDPEKRLPRYVSPKSDIEYGLTLCTLNAITGQLVYNHEKIAKIYAEKSQQGLITTGINAMQQDWE